MPDRLSELLHQVDDLPTSLAAPATVRRRGLRLRRRRQLAAGTGALLLVGTLVVGVATLPGGQARLDAPPAAPAASPPQPGPDPSPAVQSSPGPTTASPVPSSPQASTPASAEDESFATQFGYLRGFGERDGARTVLVDGVDLLPDASGAARLLDESSRIREHVLAADAGVRVAGAAGRQPRTSGLLTEVGEPSSLAELERAYAGLREGEQLLLELTVGEGSTVDAVWEVALR